MLPDAHHDNGQWHRDPRDSGEERRGANEGNGSGVDPLPVAIRRYSTIDVDQDASNETSVQCPDKPVE